MPKKQRSSQHIPSILCFSLDDSCRKNKRDRYDPGRRKEVAHVRAIGACLRCRLMNLSCSKDRPCSRCRHAALSKEASAYLWMVPCVPSMLGDLKAFFQADLPVMDTKIDVILSRNSYLLENGVTLDFGDHVAWDLSLLSQLWASSISGGTDSPSISKIGVMSSIRFQELLSSYLSPKLCIYFRLFMHTSSLIYNYGNRSAYCGYALEDFLAIRAQAGTEVLNGLERLIRFAELANATVGKKRAIFLMIFGTILAITYQNRLEDGLLSMISPKIYSQRKSMKEFSQLQEQLLQVLSHRLLDLADRLTLLADGVSRQAIVNSAKQRWRLPAAYIWNDFRFPLEASSAEKNHFHVQNYNKFNQDCDLPNCQQLSWDNPGGTLNPSSAARFYDLYSPFGSPKSDFDGQGFQSITQVEGIFSCGMTFLERQCSDQTPQSFQPKPSSKLITNRNEPSSKCKRCGILLPEDSSDGLCYTCTYLPLEPWELWLRSSSPEKNMLELDSNADLSLSLNGITAEACPDLLNSFDTVNAGIITPSTSINLNFYGQSFPEAVGHILVDMNQSNPVVEEASQRKIDMIDENVVSPGENYYQQLRDLVFSTGDRMGGNSSYLFEPLESCAASSTAMKCQNFLFRRRFLSNSQGGLHGRAPSTYDGLLV